MTPRELEEAHWFAEEVQPHETKLRGYLRRFAGAGEVDDLIQETYERLFRARKRGPVRSASGLLFATARNAAHDLFRRHAAANTISIAEVDPSRVSDDAPDTPEIVSRRQEYLLLEGAIRSLPERCRAVLILRKLESLSYREIASRLGISENTVDVQLVKALHRCERYFAQHGALPAK